MSTAFVLSGGASLGAVQVGMLRALARRSIRPDMVVGSSVGAINSAWIAMHPGLEGVEELAEIWTSLQRRDIFPLRPLIGLSGFLGRTNHLFPSNGLERLLRRHLGDARLEDAHIPLHVVATEVTSGLAVLLSSGEAVPAVLASSAIPALFPPVRIGDRDLMDGGVIDNTPISHAVGLGATTVYVLPTGYACSLPGVPGSALGMALHALTVLIERRLMDDIAHYEGTVDLHVVPPLCPLSVYPTDFSRSSELIERAESTTSTWLDERHTSAEPHRLLRLHSHRPRHQAPAGGPRRQTARHTTVRTGAPPGRS
jgi:NTE family protein